MFIFGPSAFGGIRVAAPANDNAVLMPDGSPMLMSDGSPMFFHYP